jgi:hypothetical protein
MCQDNGGPRNLDPIFASNQDLSISSLINRRAYIAAFVSTLVAIGTISPASADRSYTSMQVVANFSRFTSLRSTADTFERDIKDEHTIHQLSSFENSVIAMIVADCISKLRPAHPERNPILRRPLQGDDASPSPTHTCPCQPNSVLGLRTSHPNSNPPRPALLSFPAWRKLSSEAQERQECMAPQDSLLKHSFFLGLSFSDPEPCRLLRIRFPTGLS